MQQATRFELVINLKAANLDLTIPAVAAAAGMIT
jgi:hypothetical protein